MFASATASDMAGRLLREMMDLAAKGHIKPICPVKVFPFEDIESSLRYLRAGTHLGKVVISNGPGSAVQVPVKFTEHLLTP